MVDEDRIFEGGTTDTATVDAAYDPGAASSVSPSTSTIASCTPAR